MRDLKVSTKLAVSSLIVIALIVIIGIAGIIGILQIYYRSNEMSDYRIWLNMILIIFLIVIAIGVAVIIFLTKFIYEQVSKPLTEIGQFVDKVSTGEIDLDSIAEGSIDVRTDDEIGALARILERSYVQLNEFEQSKLEMQTITADNAALVRLNQLKNELVATISHELRTPLTVMSANAQLAVKAIARGDYADESLQRLAVIPKEAKRLADLSATLLKAFNEQRDARGKSPLSLIDLLTHTASVFKPIVDKKNNSLALHIAPNLPQVSGNSDELMQVLFNILSNADAHTKDGEITIIAREGNSTEQSSFNSGLSAPSSYFVYVSIKDTGEGIDSELLPHIFTKGWHGENGTGYGLAICKEIIEEHSGTIGVESELNAGTTIWFTLPAIKQVES